MNNDLSLYICRGDVCTRVNLGNKNGRNNLRNNGRENYDDLSVPAYTEESLGNIIQCTVYMQPTPPARGFKSFGAGINFPRVNGVLYVLIEGENGEKVLYTPVTKEMLNDLNLIDNFGSSSGTIYAKYFNSPYNKYYDDILLSHGSCDSYN